MNYIGSKNKLQNFIINNINNSVKNGISDKIFCDLFAGTGIIGRKIKNIAKQIIANDIEYYSYVLNRNYIGNKKLKEAYLTYIKMLNRIDAAPGFIAEHYCPSGKESRKYFTDQNGSIIDAIRKQIDRLKNKCIIDDDIYYFLIATLIESADKIANTTSVYGAYLKKFKKSALQKMILEPAIFDDTDKNHIVYNMDSNELIKKISGDILYIDPPYTSRQYSSNYHLLNTIALYDDFVPYGKTGLREYTRSLFCQKGVVEDVFENLLINAAFKYIFVSYSSDGLMQTSTIEKIMKKFGNYKRFETNYKRFKADRSDKRKYKDSQMKEYLHFVKRSSI